MPHEPDPQPGLQPDPHPELRAPSQRVSPRARTMWTVETLLEGVVSAALVVVVVALVDAVDVTWWGVALLGAAVAAYALVVPRWRWAVHRWEVTDTAVYTQVGWWSLEQRVAPLSRIQTVDHVVGPVERAFGLATVTVTTASAAGALRVSGLERDRARRLVDELTLRAEAAGGDAT
ncbi:PH domain-containing protein [Nocardioides sp. Leaf285]|uniref:PH domain-containing protein n=1 Tax=Nocardioides sp. Leaf285 TaxID=1736322 RepID=UPI000AC0158A|nr:PH domain-containing protein [Nocardioides sp. Leaf285]